MKFDSNGGSGSIADVTKPVGESYTIPGQSTLVRPRATFLGWNTKADGTGTSYAPGTEVNFNEHTVLTLYAQWDAPPSAATGSDGSIVVNICAGETITFKDLPTGVSYQVVEDPEAGWVLVSQERASGTISPEATSAAVFTNRYLPSSTSATVSATKLLDGAPAAEGAFAFELYEGSTKLGETVRNAAGGAVSFPFTYDEVGEHDYVIRELAGNDATIDYDAHEERVHVSVTSDEGRLSAAVSYDADGAIFRNVTKPGTLQVTKAVGGGGNPSQAFELELWLYGLKDASCLESLSWRSEGTATVATLSLAGGASRTLTLPAGTRYELREPSMPAGWSLAGIEGASGTVASGVAASATVSNTYASTGSFDVVALKSFDHGVLEAGLFSFELRDADGRVVATAANGDPGEDGQALVVFSGVSAPEAGTHAYAIAEVAGADAAVDYDVHEEPVTVVVTDNYDGTRTARVTYDADGPAFVNSQKRSTLTVAKAIEGATPVTREQGFELSVQLRDAAGAPFADERITVGGTPVTTDAEGALSLTLRGGEEATIGELPIGTRYEVTEGACDGWTLASAEGASGTIVAGGSEATLTNRYASYGEVAIAATKTMDRAFADGEFRFELLDAEGVVLQTAAARADGSVSFAPLSYAAADHGKTYSYQIREVAGSDAGVVYDEATQVVVTVRPTDRGDGTMEAAASYTGGRGASANGFANYTRGGDLAIVKEVEGDVTAASSRQAFDMTVKLRDAEGSPLARRSFDVGGRSVETDDEGACVISVTGGESATMTNLPVGASYEVSEASYPGWTLVSASGARGSIDADQVSTAILTNRYATSGKATVEARLEFERPIKEGEFRFELRDEEGNVLATAHPKAGDYSGGIDFEYDFGFGADDDGKTFTYTIVQIPLGDEEVIYDESVYTVTIKPTDRGDGTMDCPVTYVKDGAERDEALFVNRLVTIKMPATGGGLSPLALWLALAAELTGATVLVRRRLRRRKRS